jgi:deoxyribodipyrimidine photo-lyase
MSHVYQLIWFRQDLRIHDHAALWHAVKQVMYRNRCIIA